DLTHIAVGIGPGPYTGLRVGLVTGLSLADALGIDCVGVATLDALAFASGRTAPFIAATDARRKEVFWARYADAATRVGDIAVDRPAELDTGGLPVIGRPAVPHRRGPRRARRPPAAGRRGAPRAPADVPAPPGRGGAGDPEEGAAVEGVSPARIRPMAEADVAPVMELERALFPKDAWSEQMLRSELAEPTRKYYVAVDPGDPEAVIGYAGLRAVPPEGDVQTIAVRTDAQGRGIGAALLTRLLGEALDRGATEMFLEVRSDNPRARELYRRF